MEFLAELGLMATTVVAVISGRWFEESSVNELLILIPNERKVVWWSEHNTVRVQGIVASDGYNPLYLILRYNC